MWQFACWNLLFFGIRAPIIEQEGKAFFNIIANHIFQDGNKRTGLEAAIIFLRINGFNISKDLKLDELYDFTIKVASGESNLEECQTWFDYNMVKEYLL